MIVDALDVSPHTDYVCQSLTSKNEAQSQRPEPEKTLILEEFWVHQRDRFNCGIQKGGCDYKRTAKQQSRSAVED